MCDKSLEEIYEEYKDQYPGIVDFSAAEDDGILDFLRLKYLRLNINMKDPGIQRLRLLGRNAFMVALLTTSPEI